MRPWTIDEQNSQVREQGLRLERIRASPRWAGEGFRNLHPIQPGLRRPGFVEVLSGVQPNEQIVTRGSEALEDGTPVEFADAPPPTPDVPTGG